LPHPLGPTIDVIPCLKSIVILSAKDLNPKAVRFFKYMAVEEENPKALLSKA
jgi:hypothetical protein